MSDGITLLLDILPVALAAAVSPTTFAVLIVLLSLSKRPKTSGAGFLAGSFVVIFLAALLGLLAAEGAFYFTRYDPSTLKGWIDLLLGALVLYYGIKILTKKKELWGEDQLDIRPDKSALSEFVASMFMSMGLFALNFITTVLVFLGGSKIALSEADFLAKFLSLAVLIAITLILVEIPLLIYIFLPQKAEKILFKLKEWIKKNGYYLTAALIFIIGGYMLYNGLTILNWI